jgi:hypothetical protein
MGALGAPAFGRVLGGKVFPIPAKLILSHQVNRQSPLRGTRGFATRTPCQAPAHPQPLCHYRKLNDRPIVERGWRWGPSSDILACPCKRKAALMIATAVIVLLILVGAWAWLRK